ncbi:hypothetical protein ACFPOC_11675 [Rubellimicrobium aerolatum]|uniref:Uncharacterized protein n=1 Tax=Rubellimicrobium aerolatum TaxID=490979 RepID=A0ABW0SDY6_9RHOB
MIELLITACLTTAPDCRDFSLLFDAHEISFVTCMLHGPVIIAPWQQDHPDWTVQRWTCRPPERLDVAL